MKTYFFTGLNVDGELEFRFDDEGLLTGYDNRARMSREQYTWILNHFPLTADDLLAMAGKSKNIKITEVTRQPTFDEFWGRYDHKVVSSKKKARAAWERLPKAEQSKAYNFIPRYFGSIPGGVARKYAETYLNSGLWNN